MDEKITLQDIIETFGGVSATARAFKVRPQSVEKWIKRNKFPLARAVELERIGGKRFRLENTMHLTGGKEREEVRKT